MCVVGKSLLVFVIGSCTIGGNIMVLVEPEDRDWEEFEEDDS